MATRATTGFPSLPSISRCTHVVVADAAAAVVALPHLDRAAVDAPARVEPLEPRLGAVTRAGEGGGADRAGGAGDDADADRRVALAGGVGVAPRCSKSLSGSRLPQAVPSRSSSPQGGRLSSPEPPTHCRSAATSAQSVLTETFQVPSCSTAVPDASGRAVAPFEEQCVVHVAVGRRGELDLRRPSPRTCPPRWSPLKAWSTGPISSPFSRTACFSLGETAGSKNFSQFCLISFWAAAGSAGPSRLGRRTMPRCRGLCRPTEARRRALSLAAAAVVAARREGRRGRAAGPP